MAQTDDLRDPEAEIAWCVEQRREVLAREGGHLDHPQVRQGLYDLMAEEVLIRLARPRGLAYY